MPILKRPSRKEFHESVCKKDISIGKLAIKYGVSKKTIHAWKQFYKFAKRGAIGNKHSGWKGGRWLHKKSGYIYQYIGHKEGTRLANYRAEHRYVMEKHLKRKLKPSEQVHHRNGIKSDNRIKNLCLHSKSDHAKLHYKKGDYSIGKYHWI